MSDKGKFLNITNPDEYFILKNGRELKNIYELINSLISMEDDVFKHHVSDDRNDFANWIMHVFDDKPLADLVSEARDKEALIRLLNTELSTIKKSEQEKEQKEKENVKPEKKKEPQEKKVKVEKQTKLLKKKKNVKPKIKKVTKAKKQEVDLSSVIENKDIGNNKELVGKIDEILLKEKEIAKREEKIHEIEQRIEKKLSETKKQASKVDSDSGFFSKEFMQGLTAGILITLIGSLIYIKYFI